MLYTHAMEFSVEDATNRLPELIRLVEQGEQVTITRRGMPVAELSPAVPRRKPRLGGMKDSMELLPGWDDPIDIDQFLAGKF